MSALRHYAGVFCMGGSTKARFNARPEAAELDANNGDAVNLFLVRVLGAMAMTFESLPSSGYLDSSVWSAALARSVPRMNRGGTHLIRSAQSVAYAMARSCQIRASIEITCFIAYMEWVVAWFEEKFNQHFKVAVVSSEGCSHTMVFRLGEVYKRGCSLITTDDDSMLRFTHFTTMAPRPPVGMVKDPSQVKDPTLRAGAALGAFMVAKHIRSAQCTRHEDVLPSCEIGHLTAALNIITDEITHRVGGPSLFCRAAAINGERTAYQQMLEAGGLYQCWRNLSPEYIASMRSRNELKMNGAPVGRCPFATPTALNEVRFCARSLRTPGATFIAAFDLTDLRVPDTRHKQDSSEVLPGLSEDELEAIATKACIQKGLQYAAINWGRMAAFLPRLPQSMEDYADLLSADFCARDMLSMSRGTPPTL
jgi:hypothetical protein